ncbi:ribonuclease H-like domain-containing protein [Tanacetum coccineum]
MAIEDNPPPLTDNMEKPFVVTNIKSHVPLVLDLDQLNYDAWCKLFTSHCHSFGVHGLLDGSYTSTTATAIKWKNLDSLVKVWIFGTISTSLLQMVLKKNVTAKDVWKSLGDLFYDNKEARSMELQEELHSLDLGSLSIVEYLKKIKLISDLLTNIDSPISEKNLIMYAANGLSEKYEHVASIIGHNKIPMTLLGVRSMLLLEESRLSRKQGRESTRDTPSSSTVLLASGNSPNNKGRTNKEICRNFQRGFCRFADCCKFVHTRGSQNGKTLQWHSQGRLPAIQYPNRSPHPHFKPTNSSMWPGQQPVPHAYITDSSSGILGPAPSQFMRYSYGNLTSIFNKRINTSIVVGNGATIPVTNSGYRILPYLHRPLIIGRVAFSSDVIALEISIPFTRPLLTPLLSCLSVFPIGFVTPTNPPSYDFLKHTNPPSAIQIKLLTSPTNTHTPTTSTLQPAHHPTNTQHSPSTDPSSLPNNTVNESAQTSSQQDVSPSPAAKSTITPSPAHQPTSTAPLVTQQPQTSTQNPNTTSRHPMVTRSRDGMTKPTIRFTLHVSTLSPIPKNHIHASHNPHWQNAMQDEYIALIKNDTWVLVSRPPNLNVVRSMWLFKYKFNADGSLSRYKARLVANGKSQQPGINCDETFSLVVKPATIHTVLSLVVSREWPIHQLDVKNAFLHGELSETVYMHQPPDFTDPIRPDYVCHLQRSLYGLKQAPKVWGSDTAYLLLYVDDIILTASSTPVDTKKKLGPKGSPVADPSHYRSLARSLQYLTFTRPDLSYAVQQLCLYMHDPREPHLHAMNRVLLYLWDWAACPDTRRSTFGYCVFLGDKSSKHQETLSRSSVEAEYRGVANAIAETSWIRNLLCELPLSTATLVYCDNISVVYMSVNPVQHQRTKHIEIDIHFVRDKVVVSHVRVLHVPSSLHVPYQLFVDFRSSLSVCDDDGCGLEMMVVERWCCWWRDGGDDGCGLEMMVVEG